MLAPKPIVPGVGQSVAVTITIGDMAGPNGLLVTLSVVNTNFATAPASATIPSGTNTVQFNVTGVAVGNTSITAAAPNHATDTAAISTAQNAIVLPPSVLVPPGNQVQFPITLSNPAPVGGLNVTLSTVDPTIGTVSSPVFIPAGSSSGTGTATGVLKPGFKGTTTINASAPNFNSTTTVLAVNTIVITFKPAGTISVPSAASVAAAVRLSDAAPSPGGLRVSLQATDPTIASTTPATVTVAAGQLESPAFAVNGGARPNTNTTLAASASGATSGSVTVFVGPPPAISSIGAGTLAVGLQRQFSVSLNFSATDSPPGSGGLVVSLRSNAAQVTVPAQVIVPTGQSFVTFTAAGNAVTKDPTGVDQPVTITATAPAVTSRTAQVSVVPAVLQLFGVSTPRTTSDVPVTIGASVFNSSCPGCFGDVLTNPLTVTFAALDAPAGAPSTIVSISPPQATIPALGSNTGQAVTLGTPTGTGQYVITASAANVQTVASSAVTVTGTSISSITGGTLAVGMQRAFTVNLNSPAPDSPRGSGGLVVSLTSGTAQVTVPTQVIVPTGQRSTTFTAAGVALTRDAAGVDRPVTITASTPNGQQTAQMSVVPAVLQLFGVSTPRTTSDVPVTIGASVFNSSCLGCFGDVLTNPLTVTFAALDAAAGAPSTIVSISGSPVTIPALGSNTGQAVTLGTPTGTGQYVITASAANVQTVTSNAVTVTGTSINFVSGGTLAVGMQRAFTVNLDSPAPDSPRGSGGLVVSLKSGTAQITVPTQVIVPTGQRSTSFTAAGIALTRDAAGVDRPVTITASTPNSQQTTQMSVVPAVLQLFGVTTPRTTFSLSQTIGVSVFNSSCPGCFGDVLTSPLTVTFAALDAPAGAPSTIVTISPNQATILALGSNTGQAVMLSAPTGTGQYVITVSATIATNPITVTSSPVSVTQPSVTSISGSTLAVGLQHFFSVSLDSPAPSQGVVINLASSDSSLVAVPSPSVTMTAGQQQAVFLVTGVALPAGATSQTVELSASAQGVTGLKTQVKIVSSVLSLSSLQTPTTTFSQPQTIDASVLNSSCQFCFNDVLTNPLTVSFTAIDPTTGGPSSIVTVSPRQVTILSGDSSSSQVQTVTVSRPSGTGSYAIVLSAQGYPTITSATVTVTPPQISSPGSAQTLQVAALMTRNNLTIQLDAPAPPGGLTIGLSSQDTSKLTVPGTVTVPAGSTFTSFALTGVASTRDQQGVDRPVTLMLSPPQPWIGSSTSVSVTSPTFTIAGLQTTRTTQSAPDQVQIFILNPACNCGDLLDSATVIGLSIQSTTSGIATVTPATVTAAAGTAVSSVATISMPTAPGTYTLIVSANGFTTLVSTVVTVQ